MTVRKIFWEDPYLTELDAQITGSAGDRVTLDQTIAFAFSGGQQSDSGTIGGFEIQKAEKEGKEIYYTLAPEHGLKPGDAVKVTIDWKKRYALMRLHFAAELVLETVYQMYNRPQKIGANITEHKARVDFFWEGSIAKNLPQISEKVSSLVDADLENVSAFSDRENEVRFWEIAGFAKVPCGGTHIKRTGEIGKISLRRDNIGKGKERIEICLID